MIDHIIEAESISLKKDQSLNNSQNGDGFNNFRNPRKLNLDPHTPNFFEKALTGNFGNEER